MSIIYTYQDLTTR